MVFRRRASVLTVSFVLALSLAASAQTPSAGRETTAASVAGYALSQNMPVDPEATVGTLPNGLRYYVRANGKPAHRAELRLVVRAGSVLEDDDQKGLAHFVEHMEFEGTANFPQQSITEFLNSLGLSIGADANAATSYDDTQYTLRVPTDAGVLDRALLILEDWTHAATFDPAGIDRERGIVLSEWRMRLGAGERMADKIRRVQLEGSRYADRTPIGEPQSIESATREKLLRFYRDWYRPDLMAVIVVGDVDPPAVEKMIKDHFSSLTAPSPARPRPDFDVPDHAGTRYSVIADKETTATAVRVSDLRPARNQLSVGGYRDIMKDQLFAAMLAARLDEMESRADAPFLRATADRGLFPTVRTRDESLLQALVTNDGVPRGLDALLTELQRVARFGFTATELARAKQARLLGYERGATESPDRESASRADEYTRNFLQGEALPTIWQELAFHRRFLPEITLTEINALAADWFPNNNRLVVVTAPDAPGVRLPTQAQLDAVVTATAAKRLTAYVDTAAGEKLLETPPAAGSIVKTTPRPEAGITEWTLSNGATVVLKPTTLKEDQILFRAFAPGGTSIATDADFISARIADDVVPAGGVGRLSSVMLDKLLTGKAVAVAPFINETDQGMAGGSTPQDLEAMFQLIYLRFTQPRADPTVFSTMASRAKALLANRAASPDVVFNQTVSAALTQNNPRRRPETPATVDQWNLDKALSFYKARFADASGFTFVFVGSFTPEMLKPMVERYLASLPATRKAEKARDLGIAPPPGVVVRTIQKGIAPKSQVAIVLSGSIDYDQMHLMAFRTVTLLLQSRLLDTIRQELGGTYSITVNPDVDKFPRPMYQVRIEWTCDPARTTALTQRVLDEINVVRNVRLTEEHMVSVREGLLREFETNSQDNGYFLQAIAQRYEDGDTASLGSVVHVPEQLQALTPEMVNQAARAYLNTDNYVKVTLMPEAQ